MLSFRPESLYLASICDTPQLRLKNEQTNFVAHLDLLMPNVVFWVVFFFFFFPESFFSHLSLSDYLQTQYTFPVLSVTAVLHTESYGS